LASFRAGEILRGANVAVLIVERRKKFLVHGRFGLIRHSKGQAAKNRVS